MRKPIFRLAASFAFVFLCQSAEARGHRHSAYRHVNSRGHVSYYHGHGGHHHASILISTPTDRPHKYLYRYMCHGANGPHYCYKYPSDQNGLHEGDYADAPPASGAEMPVPGAADDVQRLARELGAASAARVGACQEPAEMFEQTFNAMLTGGSTRARSPLGDSTLKYFLEGLHSPPARNKSCSATKDNYAKATVRLYSALYTEEGHPETIYAVRLGAARYEKMCLSADIREEGDRISTEMLAKLGLTPDFLPSVDAKQFEKYARAGELGCITAARIARW